MLESELVGVWKTDQRPANAKPEDGDVVVEFRQDGLVEYSIYYQEKKDKIFLNYRVDRDQLVFDQSLNKATTRTKFVLNSDGSLLLWFNGVQWRFVRASQPAL
jgi:hypothetical protein